MGPVMCSVLGGVGSFKADSHSTKEKENCPKMNPSRRVEEENSKMRG